jgi:hypothetical protein
LLPMGRDRRKVTGEKRARKKRAPQNKKPAELAIAVNGRGDGRYTATVRTHNRIRRYYRKTFACSDECHAQKLAAAFALIISPDRWDCARRSTDAKFTTSIGKGMRTAMQEVWEQEQSKAKQMLAEEQERHTSTQQIGELQITACTSVSPARAAAAGCGRLAPALAGARVHWPARRPMAGTISRKKDHPNWRTQRPKIDRYV